METKRYSSLEALREEQRFAQDLFLLLIDMLETQVMEVTQNHDVIRQVEAQANKPERKRSDAERIMGQRGANYLRDTLRNARNYRAYLTTMMPEEEQYRFVDISDVLHDLIIEACKQGTVERIRERFKLND